MRGRSIAIAFFALALGAMTSSRAIAVTFPTNFAVDDAVPGAAFNVPTSIAFLPDGRFFVTEKRGRVYEVRNGVKQPNPLWANENEVLDVNDRGLLCVAADPNYFQNHFIYLLYTVDPDSNGNDNNDDAFARLTRYQVNFTDSASVIASSRTILFGYNWPNGPLSASPSHTIGALRWGRDGSLLVSVGDGAQFDVADGGGQDPNAFGTGKTDPNENIGAFRSQDITSLDGKVLRINPANGHGYASNPYANSNLGSVQSRVWCYGLRNPFRFNVRPSTGVADTSAGSPGTLYIGDVGWNTWEEMNVCKVKGVNFGWPCYEGLGPQGSYQALGPSHNGCGTFGSGTNPAQPTAPLSTWNHGNANLSVPSGFSGNTSIGGVFYTRTQYPVQYRNQYIFGDYGQNWIKLATLDVNDNLVSITTFIDNADGPVDFATDPLSGDVFYVSILTNQVRRIRYTAAQGGNTPPVAAANGNPVSGPAPLTVNFSSAGSMDPDGDPITLSWVFTDGTGSTQANPSHTFANPGTYNVQLTVSDNKGGTDIRYVTVTANPPSGPFPSTPVVDNFNRANGNLGGSWVDGTAGLQISNNAMAQTAGSVSNSVVWNGATFGANQEAYVTFVTSPAAAQEQNLMLKVQGTSWSAGHIEVNYNATQSKVYVNTYEPANGWIGRGNISGVNFNAGDTFGARADSIGNVEIFRNGGKLGQLSVAGWPFMALGGRVGLTLTQLSGSTLDNFGAGNTVSNLNTKPVAQILQPTDGDFYYTGETINLSGTATDAQSASNLLTYNWVVDLLHNNHVHPASWVFTGTTASFLGVNHDDGTGVHLLVKFTATDPQGLVSDTAKVFIWPELDLVPSAVTVTPDPPISTQSANFSFKLYDPMRMPVPISHWVLRAGANVLAQGDTVVAAGDSAVINVSAIMPASGTYTLRLTADSLNAAHETNENNNVSVRTLVVNPVPGNHAPVAAASGNPLSGQAPLTVNFSGAGSTDSDGDPLAYAWAFGDGTNGAGVSTSHTYNNAGTYNAVLTVTDGRGGSGTAGVTVNVSAPPNTFPQTAVLDNFNRANGAIGGSWVDGTSGLTVNNNQLAQTVSDNSTVWNGGTFGATQEEYITFATASASAAEQNLMLKVQGTSWNTGHIEVAYNAPQSRVTVNTYAPTQGWVGRGTINNVTFAAGDRFGARTDASGNVDVYKNSTKVGTLSAGNWPFVANGGRLGLTLSGASGSRYDDFGGGTVTGTPVPQSDLQVSAVTAAPDSPTATQNALYSFKLYNRGSANAGTSHWVLRAGNTLLGQGDNAINARDSASLSVTAAIPTAGTYALRLVADSLGAVAESIETNNASVRTLTVNPLPGNNPPIAAASGSPLTGTAPLLVNFSGAGSSDPDSDPLGYAWAFGDGGSGSGLTTSHTYAAGNFFAILTVTDGRGGSDTAGVNVSVTPAATGFPQTAVLDNFNRANGAIGGSWVDATSGLTVNTNQLAQTVTTNSTVWNGGTFGATQEAYLTIATASATAQEQNIMLKVQGTSWSAGHIEVAYIRADGKVYVNTYAPAQGWVGRGSVAASFASGNQFGARCDASGNVTIYKNGVLLGTLSVGNWPFAGSGGRLGLTLTGTSAARFDDFGGGTVPGTLVLAQAPDPMAMTQSRTAPLPASLELSKPFPNPTDGSVAMTLDLPKDAQVDFAVFDVQGRQVWGNDARGYGAGRWTLRWDGMTARGHAGAGVYLARVRVNGETMLRRFAIVR
jgi:PKD repeat protein